MTKRLLLTLLVGVMYAGCSLILEPIEKPMDGDGDVDSDIDGDIDGDVDVDGDGDGDGDGDTDSDADDECREGQIWCNEECINPLDNVEHCGRCGNNCEAFPGVETARCTDGECDVIRCQDGLADCDFDGDGGDGCETDITTTENCGTCFNDCNNLPDVAEVHCTETLKCQIDSCERGFYDLDAGTGDGSIQNGCEYECERSPHVIEIPGNSLDDDCDGEVDEDEGLMLFMPFEDNIEDGVTEDWSSYGNDGAIHGGVTVAEGVVGQALEFDGESGYVEIPFEEFPLDEGSVSLWFRPNWDYDETHTSPSEVLFGYTPERWVNNIWVWTYCRYAASALVTIDTETVESRCGISGWVAGEWHHLVATWSVATEELIFYLDGVPQGPAVYTGITAISDSIFIATHNRTGAFANGTIDEVFLFGRSLTPDEVRTSYNTTTVLHTR